jgi:hypothetical protein
MTACTERHLPHHPTAAAGEGQKGMPREAENDRQD